MHAALSGFRAPLYFFFSCNCIVNIQNHSIIGSLLFLVKTKSKILKSVKLSKIKLPMDLDEELLISTKHRCVFPV